MDPRVSNKADDRSGVPLGIDPVFAISVGLLDARHRQRLERLATSNLSDAMDKLGLRGAVIGIVPQWGRTRLVGRAVTIRMTAAGAIESKTHLGAVADCRPTGRNGSGASARGQAGACA